MISEMLERQSFKADPGTGLLRYTVADKTRLLREFAAGNAEGRADFGERFGEFPRSAIHQCAQGLASRLDAVDDPISFVDEIVERSGLIVAVGSGMCVFAHRSIQEYLVAEQLRQFDPDGTRKLLERAADPAWRQIVLFYTGTDRQSQAAVDEFLLRLAEDDLPLAGHCLAGAKVTNPVARQLLDALANRVRAGHEVTVHLAAMLSATRSPRTPIRELAVFLVRDVLGEIISRPDVFDLLGADVDGVVQILTALAGTEAANVAELVPKVAAAAVDDPRLVAPLWQCLAVADMAEQPGTARIVERLLALVMTADGLAELERQERHIPEFATPQVRAAVYPFRKGHPPTSNLVTLLCWAERLGAVPIPPNRFFEARSANSEAFARVEADRGHTQWLRLHWPARLLSVAGAIGALAGGAALLGLGKAFGVESSVWMTLWWAILPLVAVPVVFFVVTEWARKQPPTSFAGRYLRSGAAPGTGRSGQGLAEVYTRIVPGTGAQILFLLTTLVYVVAPFPLYQISPGVYIAVALAANTLMGWMPFLRMFDRGRRVYLYRPNPYTDMYDDVRSLPWLDPRASQINRPQPLTGNRPE